MWLLCMQAGDKPVLCPDGAGQAQCVPSRGMCLCHWCQTKHQGGKYPTCFLFQRRIAARSMTRDEGTARDGSCITLLSPMRLRNCCFAFFSLKSISPLSRCTSRKGAEAAASQRICARQTVKYLKPELSEGRPLAHVIETYNAQTLGHLGLS